MLHTFYLCNARSLNNKFDELYSSALDNTFDIGAITETWFKPDLPPAFVSIPGFTMFSKSRLTQRGGGVALYAKHNQNPEQLYLDTPDDLEVLWVKIRPPRLPRAVSYVVVAVVYYPPGSPVADRLLGHLHETIDNILTNHQDAGIVIMGDFNQLDLTQLLNEPGFKQVVNQPTRENRTLDKIISNVASHYAVPCICSPIGRSDHNTVIWSPLESCNRTANFTQNRITRPMRDSNIRQFGTWICSHDWSSVMQATDPNQQTIAFYNTLNSAIDHHFPIRTTKLHAQDKPWMTPAITSSLIQQRQDAFHHSNTRTWKHFRNKVVRSIHMAKELND